MKTLINMEVTCIPDGEEDLTTGKIGPPRYRVARWYDDGSFEEGEASVADVKKYRQIMGKIDAGASVW